LTRTIVDVDLKDAPGDSPDEKTLMWVRDLRERAKNARSEVFDRMDTNSDFYEAQGKQWGNKSYPTYRAKIEDNRCFSNVESALPIITDNRPKAELVPSHPDDTIAVKDLKDAFDAKWEDLDLDLMVTLSEKDALVLSEGYWKVWFDPSLLGGVGDLNVSQVSPRNIYPDPYSKHPLLKDAYYIIYSAPVSISRLLLQYPHKADAIKKEFAGKSPDPASKDNRGQSEYAETAHDVGDTPSTTLWNSTKALAQDQKLTFNEVWVDDQTAEEHAPDYIVYLDDKSAVEKTDESWQSAIQSGREYDIFAAKDLPKIDLEDGTKYYRKYPNGRIIAWIGNTILRDEPSPYEHGRCPYVRFFRYTVPDKNYFFGEIDQIIPLQEELNKRKSQAIDLLNLVVNPPMLVYAGSGIDINKVTNRPGLILPTNVPVDQAAKWLQMPNVPSEMFVQMSTINQDIDTVSGIHDVTQGRNPSGITAGIAIESLQEAAQTRLRLASRYLEYSIKHAAELMVSIIWQYYKEPRMIRQKSSNGWTYKTVNFANSELQGDMPAVKIQAGSTMQTNKAVLKQQGITLYQIGAIDRRAILELFDYPDTESIIGRMGEGGMQGAETAQGGNPQALSR
jgi:hypothetical protein